MMRGSPEVRIWPNVELFVAAVGLFGRIWFGRLNASARASSVCRSRTRNSRETATLTTTLPGPRTLRAPRLPYVPVAGDANAAGLSQTFAVWLAAYGLAKTRFGRWLPTPDNA